MKYFTTQNNTPIKKVNKVTFNILIIHFITYQVIKYI